MGKASDASVFRSNIEAPVNDALLTVSLLEPLVGFFEMTAVKLKQR